MLRTQTTLRHLSSNDHMPWIQGRRGYIFQSKPMRIDADRERVWQLVSKPNEYDQLSHGAVWAQVNGEVLVNKRISFKLFRHRTIGFFIPQSDEIITKVDPQAKTIGWERKFPLLGTTERYQVLEANEDGSTMSYIALKVPGIVGFFTNLFLKSTIEESFNALTDGIKVAAEHKTV